MAMRYPPDRRPPSRPRRRGGPPLPRRLPPGYDEALTLAKRYNRAYSRHSQRYQAFGPIPRRTAYPSRTTTPIVVSEQPETSAGGGNLVLTAAIVIIAVVALGFGLGSQTRPTPQQSLPPDTSYSVIGGPSVSATFIDRVLTSYGSPAAGRGQALYDLGTKYSVDPVFALAFFMHESSFGKAGMATVTLALGNERCLTDRPCVNTQGDPCQAGQSCYAQFTSWEDGFEHWYMLITGPLYKGAGLTTVAQIIPRYAPDADNNNEGAYISSVEHAVDTWRKGAVLVA